MEHHPFVDDFSSQESPLIAYFQARQVWFSEGVPTIKLCISPAQVLASSLLHQSDRCLKLDGLCLSHWSLFSLMMCVCVFIPYIYIYISPCLMVQHTSKYIHWCRSCHYTCRWYSRFGCVDIRYPLFSWFLYNTVNIDVFECSSPRFPCLDSYHPCLAGWHPNCVWSSCYCFLLWLVTTTDVSPFSWQPLLLMKSPQVSCSKRFFLRIAMVTIGASPNCYWNSMVKCHPLQLDKGDKKQKDLLSPSLYPLVICYIAIEHDPFYSWFTQTKHGDFP